MAYYAHSDKEKDKSQWQLLKDHLTDTGTVAAAFAKVFGADSLVRVAGLLHDAGKYTLEFQMRLEGHGSKVDHSTAGAFEAVKCYCSIGKLLAYIIAGHHCGLPDWGSMEGEGSLEARLNKKLYDYSAFSQEIELPPPQSLVFPRLRPVDGMQGRFGKGFSAQFLVRFLYSCLVDADFLDTERALNPAKSTVRRRAYMLNGLSDALDCYLDGLCAKTEDTSINEIRRQVLANCRNKARFAPGLFTLTVPTGGGKTLSSLSFALGHALQYGQERVIYVVPYTTIIEQNAAVFKEVLGEENVLEHHSNFSYLGEGAAETESEYAAENRKKLQLATENWDLPVIVTTNVQFFESLFAARSSKCRKLHNIANSVVIIDEAQMIPTDFLKPCLYALAELVMNYCTTVVLCTATQPAVEKILPSEIKPIEIIDEPAKLYEVLKRVQVQSIGAITDEELYQRLLGHERVLCIVNSKKHARILYEGIRGEGSFHLSTRMCPAHRSKTIEMIKQRLKAGQVCRVVSTQLIEAGVDIDFPVVYRSMAGTDSIAQSAGRCNREGHQAQGQLYVFWPEQHGRARGWLSRTAALGARVIDHHSDPLELEAVKEYFTDLYDIDATQLDKEGILDDIKEQEKLLKFPFRSIAEKFKLIDENTYTIVVSWDERCRNTLAEARTSRFPGGYARRLQRYGVDVFEREFQEISGLEILEVVAGRFYVLKDDVFKLHYSEETGLIPFTESMFLNDTMLI